MVTELAHGLRLTRWTGLDQTGRLALVNLLDQACAYGTNTSNDPPGLCMGKANSRVAVTPRHPQG